MTTTTNASSVQAKVKVATIDDFIGLLAGKTSKIASLAEIKEAAERGWAGQK